MCVINIIYISTNHELFVGMLYYHESTEKMHFFKVVLSSQQIPITILVIIQFFISKLQNCLTKRPVVKLQVYSYKIILTFRLNYLQPLYTSDTLCQLNVRISLYI